MHARQIIDRATQYLYELANQSLNILTVHKPSSADEAINLAKVISKLSPLVGNLIEFRACEYLNRQGGFNGCGAWRRQDPGFPDTIFVGDVEPTPGLEIKAWFPLATEITARFKDSRDHFLEDQTHVVILAWLPEFLIFGKPTILDVVVVSGRSVAYARDRHYHNPPGYLVVEPGDTASRTRNFRQTNTNGYKFQGSSDEFKKARQVVESWGIEGGRYSSSPDYQRRLQELKGRFPYRLDTNFAKMDRIKHVEIEHFKERVLQMPLHGHTIGEWNRLLSRCSLDEIKRALAESLNVGS